MLGVIGVLLKKCKKQMILFSSVVIRSRFVSFHGTEEKLVTRSSRHAVC